MSHRIKVFAALTATMLFWAFSFVWTKVAFTVWTPISTIWLRLVLSSLFIFGYLVDIPVILTPLSGDIDPPKIGLVQRA